MKETVRKRFAAAGLASGRFVSVKDGAKMCTDHDTRYDEPREVPGENYGIYSDEDDQLVILDVDVHRGGGQDHDDRALVGIAGLGMTLRVRSPHADEELGGHRIFKLTGDETPADLFDRVFGRKNPVPTWGEVLSKNKYAVGPGSQLNDCTKEWCEACADADGGRYVVDDDRAIATVEPDDLVNALAADPDLSRTDTAEQADQSDLSGYDASQNGTDSDLGATETLPDPQKDEYDELSRDQVEALLEALPGDQKFTPWITTGYAVYDWDDSDTGKEVFTEWSRTNEKWERQESQRQIDYIWQNGESGDGDNKASVATLIHKAREAGYDGSLGTSKPTPTPDPSVLDWETVRDAYAAHHSATPDKFARKMAADLLLEENEYAAPTDTEELHQYHEPSGVYDPGAVPMVKETLRLELGAHCSNSEINEIVESVRQRSYIEREEFNGGEDERLLCVGNGVLDLDTRELRDHSPDYYFTRALAVSYDADAKAPAIEQFLDEITERDEDKQTMVEMVGSALWPDYLKAKFMILFGEGGNGKSIFYHVVKELLGPENVSGWDLQDLGDNRFATSALVGKFANIGGDMDAVKVKNTGVLKKLTGGDQMMVEQKNEPAHEFVNSATLLFGANRPPVIDEASRAVKRRLVPVRLPYEFTNSEDELSESKYVKVAKKKDELKSELTTDSELAGFLNMALDGLDRLRENGDVSLPESQEERLEYYEQFSDPIKEFAVRCLVNQPNARIEKDSVYSAYKEFCADRDYTNRQKSTFFRQLARTTFDVNTVRAGSDGQRTQMLDSAALSDVGKEYAPEYFGASEESTSRDTDDDTADLEGLEPGFADLEVTIAEKLEPPEWLAGKGHVVDDDGNILPYVCEGSDPLALAAEDATVTLSNVKIENRKGVLTAVLSGVTSVESDDTPTDVDDDQTPLNAATDGGDGDEARGTGVKADTERLMSALENNGATAPEHAVDVPTIWSWTTEIADADRVETLLERGREHGRFADTADGDFYVL